MKQLRLAVILPVHNEEKTIDGVVKSLLSFDLFDEIIAVTDGTIDDSPKVLDKYAKAGKIIWLNYKRNRGKGFALARGVKKSTADIVVFFDTDQATIKKEHLTTLTDPLVAGEADCMIGSHGSDFKLDPFRHVCGNRSYFRKDLLPYLKVMEGKRRGIELFLNHELSQKKKRIVLTHLPGLTHCLKHNKRTTQEALRDYLREGYELAVEYARQKKLSGQERTEFVKSHMIEFLKGYGRYFDLPAGKVRAIVSEFLDNIRSPRKFW